MYFAWCKWTQSGLQYYHFINFFFFFFLPQCPASRISVSQPGIKSVSPALGSWSLNHWTTREVPIIGYFGTHFIEGCAVADKLSTALMCNTMQPLKSLYERAYFMGKCLWYISLKAIVVLVQLLSRARLFTTPRTEAHQASLFFTISWSLHKLTSIESVIPSNRLVLCHPLLFLPSIFPGIRVFSNELPLRIRWPKYWSFSFSISPSNEHPGLISFRMDWFDLLAVQGTLKSLLQHHSSRASIFQHSDFFKVQLSHPYVTAYTIA